LDISDFPTRHNYGLALLQSHTERLLATWVGELRVPIARQREVTASPRTNGVDVELVRRPVATGGLSRRLRRGAQCDPEGGRDRVPRLGSDDRWVIAEVEVDEVPEFGWREGGGIGPGTEGEYGSW